ncbi:cysteine--tRNA ligase [Synechococcus sp. CC9311]|uniref:cysteine--tRNA ligase n=1 Tax=Synechococcus sp. (strain CC9311) TaxID=64471 RepID=UPI0000DDAC91|nr:cysteine--tRNA ligase [Synechococcus sp. CC9311]ABI46908.1 cysteinyl-tRNA synthetase [Synechococcus sp. CC9311]
MSSLRFTNSLTSRTEAFEPLEPGKATIYCCGVTVYDLCHLGHARSYINWDVLRRYLIWRGYDVTYIQNYTDIDDKILNRASEEGSTMQAVSERNIEAFEIDMGRLNILPADRMPRATCCIEGIQTLIAELETKGAAYSSDGDVYFDISKAKDYGKLSGRDPNEQQQGASGRTADGEESRKKHPFDFALWKGSKVGEPSWDSPWGPGRPGWHIECSAMVRQELGLTIDIHLGGGDLVFPHHENEIAQSETANGAPLARLWMHNGMVNVGGTKMSKSLGNFTTIRALLESGLSAMALRLFVLQAHYRKPLDFTAEALEASTTGWKGLNAALKLGETHAAALEWSDHTALSNAAVQAGRNAQGPFEDLEQRFTAAMDDDLNSSGALAVLFELARPLRGLANRLDRGDQPEQPGEELTQLHSRWLLLRELAAVLGLRSETDESQPSENSGVDAQAIEQAIANRKAAKQEKNYQEADRIRKSLSDQGIELIDKPGGLTDWRLI